MAEACGLTRGLPCVFGPLYSRTAGGLQVPMSLRKPRVIGVSMLCGLCLCPETARADRIDPESETLSTLSLNGFNKAKIPILNDVMDGMFPLTEPGDKQDSGENDTLTVPKITFDFTELDGTPSDELTFDPFTIMFFSDLPTDLPKGIKIVLGGTESTSEGSQLRYPLVQFEIDSENRAENKDIDESDTPRVVAATHAKTGTRDFRRRKHTKGTHRNDPYTSH
jgi:hypothetical protein